MATQFLNGLHDISPDSCLTLKEFNKDVIEYLKSKGISDFTKFEAAIDKDKPHFLKWDYNIEQPKDIVLKLIPKSQHIFLPKVYNYILIIGASQLNYKATEYEIDLSGNQRLEAIDLDIKKISAQVSFYQDTYNRKTGYDDIFCSIRSIRLIDKNTIRIELFSYRHFQEAWRINHKVFLQITISDKDIEIINPIASLVKPVIYTIKND